MKRLHLSRLLILVMVLLLCFGGIAFAAAPEAGQPAPRDLTELFIAIISLASVVLTLFAAPAFKANMDEKRLKKMLEVADTAVGAAWDLLKTQPGQERLQYALNVMRQHGYTANAPMIEDMLKSAWVRLKNDLIGSGNLPPEAADVPEDMTGYMIGAPVSQGADIDRVVEMVIGKIADKGISAQA